MASNIKVKKLDDRAKMPEKAHETDTGYDIQFIDIDKIVGDVIYFKTGLSVQPPKGYYFEVYPRSSLSKLPLSMANSVGIIDNGYRGEILVPVRVHHQFCGFDTKQNSFAGGLVSILGSKPQTMLSLANLIIYKQPKLFQLVLRKKFNCIFTTEDDLGDTERGDGGFGSSDLKEMNPDSENKDSSE